MKDFPDSKTLYEYEDYLTKPTKVNASAFITLDHESNRDAIHESEQYMKYIATRLRAERIGSHGLFGDDESSLSIRPCWSWRCSLVQSRAKSLTAIFQSG